LSSAAAGLSLIINETSGGASRQDTSAQLEALFNATGTKVRLERVRHGGDLSARARQAASRGDTLVAAGGDGTVNAVAAVAVETGATLGVVPSGTLNHFAKDLRIPLDPAAAVETVVAGHVQMVDVGEVNGRIFVNNSSLGIYPRMVWERDAEERRGRRKAVAFAIAMLRTWRNYRTIAGQLLIDGAAHVVRTPFIFIGNNEYVAEGFNLGARTSLDEGRLSVFVAPEIGRFEILTLPLRALLRRLDPDAHLTRYSAADVQVELARSRVSVALDGEVSLMRSPLRYRVRPGALRVLVPATPPV